MLAPDASQTCAAALKVIDNTHLTSHEKRVEMILTLYPLFIVVYEAESRLCLII